MDEENSDDRCASTRVGSASMPKQYYTDDEISLFDLWDILVRRWRWVVGVGLVVALLGVAHVLTRVEQYEYTHVIEIGQWPVIDPARSAVDDGFEDGARFLEPPETVAAKLEEKYLPAAIGLWQESHRETGWWPRISKVSADDSGMVTMQAKGLAEHESAYFDILKTAALRLSEGHEQILRSTRQALQIELSRARNYLESLKQTLAHRKGEVQRIERHLGIVDEEVEALEALLDDTARRLEVAQRNSGEPAKAMAVMMLTNEVFAARGRLDEYRVQRAVELPRQRDQVEAEIAELEREIGVQGAEIALRESRIEMISPTRVLSEPRRSAAPVGTSDGVIVALSVVLGGMLGVFTAFFAEFVHAANRRRQEEGSGGGPVEMPRTSAQESAS